MRITDLSPNWRGTRGYQPPASGVQRSLVRCPTSTVRPRVGRVRQLASGPRSVYKLSPVRFTAQSFVPLLRFETQFKPRCSIDNTDDLVTYLSVNLVNNHGDCQNRDQPRSSWQDQQDTADGTTLRGWSDSNGLGRSYINISSSDIKYHTPPSVSFISIVSVPAFLVSPVSDSPISSQSSCSPTQYQCTKTATNF